MRHEVPHLLLAVPYTFSNVLDEFLAVLIHKLQFVAPFSNLLQFVGSRDELFAHLHQLPAIEQQMAQIQDIVKRKADIAAENIVITPVKCE